jgi:hypothetical protein
LADPINWHCPHCHHKVTITDDRRSLATHLMETDTSDGRLALRSEFRVCPNPECRKASLTAALWKWRWVRQGQTALSREFSAEAASEWSLIPRSDARPFPDYVPQAIRDDYEEGCLIRDLSPKASATLARRALQGILRDFYRVKPGRLVDEIRQLKDTMEPELWDAIEGVRKIGNIGAHMEADIDVIVDVDANEARVLLELVETMIEETYVHRAERQARLTRVSAIAAEKADAKRPSGPKPPEAT